MNAKSFTALVAAAGLLAVANSGQAAQQPSQADFDACNKEAQAKAGGPAASPSTGARGGASAGGSISGGGTSVSGGATTPGGGAGGGVTGGATTSGTSDEQLQGMAAAGQNDPAYQQAYRECLQRRGF
jgi:hypothetical protein